ncbi:RfbX Membrane protein involved in the export of O-antigen and teichoic acid [Comamonadaceae bacterium]
MVGGQFTVAISQGLQFLLLARALGPQEFGLLAGVLAISSMLLPFSGLGAANVMIMRFAQKVGDLQTYYGNALIVACVSSIVLIAIGFTIGAFLFGHVASIHLLLLICVSEILLAKLVDITAHVYYAQERHRFAGTVYSFQSLARLAFAAVFVVSNISKTADSWALWHILSGLVSAAFALWFTHKQIGAPTLRPKLALQEIKTGVFFSIGLSAKSLYTDIDKAALARLASTEVAGAYTAAFRMIYMAATPLRAVLLAGNAKFFRDGQGGLTAPLRFANRITLYGIVYAAILAIAVWFGAPLIQVILGQKYSLSVDMIRWLAVLPMVQIIQESYSDALMGAGYQVARSILQALAAFLCIGLNIILIQQYSWQGAVYATYITQIALTMCVVALALVVNKKSIK